MKEMRFACNKFVEMHGGHEPAVATLQSDFAGEAEAFAARKRFLDEHADRAICIDCESTFGFLGRSTVGTEAPLQLGAVGLPKRSRAVLVVAPGADDRLEPSVASAFFASWGEALYAELEPALQARPCPLLNAVANVSIAEAATAIMSGDAELEAPAPAVFAPEVRDLDAHEPAAVDAVVVVVCEGSDDADVYRCISGIADLLLPGVRCARAASPATSIAYSDSESSVCSVLSDCSSCSQ